MLKLTPICFAITLLGALDPTPATAAAPGSGFSVNAGGALVSDYRFRGISQTDRRFAIQGTASVSHTSGFYGAVWGSSIADYVAHGAEAELDLSMGYKKSIGSTTIDGGLLYYYYPNSGGVGSDFVEAYLSVSHSEGPVTIKAAAAYAPKQNALSIGDGREDNLYIAGDVGFAIPRTRIGLNAHLGHSFGPSYLTIGDEYTDWSLGVTLTHHKLTAGLSYVDTDKSVLSARGRDIGEGGIVASLGFAF